MSRTLAGPVRHEAIIKRSRFIARAAPCLDETDARTFINQASDVSASHNCWAWKVGQRYRFDDDGEPGGTAGRPILQAIDGQDMDRVVVVVTRHFGGIKLGAGGLARAYGGTAAEVLRAADSRTLVRHVRLRLTLPFDCVDATHQAMTVHGARKIDETYDADGAILIISLPESQRRAFAETVRDHARGRARIARI
ncbi:MAG: YigZ family protein [Pseudomonadota bacterium]|nr:MAG: YigZ family protein [Pseudomonadota bacterium]